MLLPAVNLLRFPLAFLPFLITMLVNAAVALKRIQGFLEKGETTAVVDTESVEPGVVKVGGCNTAPEAPELSSLPSLPAHEAQWSSQELQVSKLHISSGSLPGTGAAQALHQQWQSAAMMSVTHACNV